MPASDITDITWSMMTGAGIDIDLVERRPTELGADEYILIDGDTQVAFGPAVATEAFGDPSGWNIATYERDSDDQGEYWREVRQDWAETPAEALRLVAAEAR